LPLGGLCAQRSARFGTTAPKKKYTLQVNHRMA